MSDSIPDLNLIDTTDARVWAREWCRVAREIEAGGSGLVIDQGWMTTWFANALETGRRAGQQGWR